MGNYILVGMAALLGYFFVNKKADVVLSGVEFEGAMNINPRGIRNNNPLNIKWNSINNWQGQVGKDDKGFVIFDTPENGIRAAARLLNNYKAQGISTVRSIVEKWTGGDSELIQSAYIEHVSNVVGASEFDVLIPAQYPILIEAMILHENGLQPYSGEQIMTGIAAA